MSLLKIFWPWGVIADQADYIETLEDQNCLLAKQIADTRGRNVQLEGRIKDLKNECSRVIEEKTEIERHLEPVAHPTDANISPEKATIRKLQGHVKSLQRQVDQYQKKAATDVRSGYIMADQQQATDIKFRSVKVDLQCMKKINKQASCAIRYVAQKIQSNAIQSDLRAIAEIIHPDAFNAMGIESMTTADMVEDTIAMGELVRMANGKKEA